MPATRSARLSRAGTPTFDNPVVPFWSCQWPAPHGLLLPGQQPGLPSSLEGSCKGQPSGAYAVPAEQGALVVVVVVVVEGHPPPHAAPREHCLAGFPEQRQGLQWLPLHLR